MNKSIRILLIALLLSLLAVNTAFAAHGEPAGRCPRGFELHHFMAHEDHEQQHIGLDKDLNGDGYICVKHLTPDLHLHVDNLLPIQ